LLDNCTLWLTIAGMGIITFLLRLSFIALMGRIRLPASVRRGLDFVPSAVFSALILPDLVQYSVIEPLPLQMHARLIAGGVAVLVAWRTRNVVLTIGAGLVALFILQTVL
jgi:branched-subunit amino acid transport protein